MRIAKTVSAKTDHGEEETVCGMRNAECGMWNAECGMRNAKTVIAREGAKPQRRRGEEARRIFQSAVLYNIFLGDSKPVFGFNPKPFFSAGPASLREQTAGSGFYGIRVWFFILDWCSCGSG